MTWRTEPQEAERHGVCTRTLRDWRRLGMPYTALGRVVRYREDLVDTWLAGQHRPAPLVGAAAKAAAQSRGTRRGPGRPRRAPTAAFAARG